MKSIAKSILFPCSYWFLWNTEWEKMGSETCLFIHCQQYKFLAAGRSCTLHLSFVYWSCLNRIDKIFWYFSSISFLEVQNWSVQLCWVHCCCCFGWKKRREEGAVCFSFTHWGDQGTANCQGRKEKQKMKNSHFGAIPSFTVFPPGFYFCKCL